ncbi:hypothetical protein Ancab_016448 [Ancistrocladus abbreviatus]
MMISPGRVVQNAFCFAIWFTRSANKTVVWVANRDYPVNGKDSKLELTQNGNLELIDAGPNTICSSNATTTSEVQLRLSDNGNLLLDTLTSNATP